MAERDGRKTEQDFVALVRHKAYRYLNSPGVTSVGVGYRQRRNEKTQEIEVTDELCIQFTVFQKYTLENLQDKNTLPLPVSLEFEDGAIAGVDVIERSFEPNYEVLSDPIAETEKSELSPRQLRRSRVDIVAPGVSVSHRYGSAGTVGAIVYDNRTGAPLLLSNWHVLAGRNEAQDDEIIQPGRFDSSDLENNRVGRLVRSHLGLAGDCAVSTIESRRFTEEILELKIAPRRSARANLGDLVIKSGRTTGVTHGVVTRVGVAAKIQYGSDVGIREIGCFEIRPSPDKPPAEGEISKGGDSGSIWLIDGTDCERDIAVGLHFAGEINPAPSEEHALACNIHSVLEKLDVAFLDAKALTVTEEELWNDVLGRLDSLEIQAAVDRQTRIGQTERLQAAPEDGLGFYGRWCGPGHGSGEPKDDVDRACMEHDKCYDRKGYLDCGCDSQLLGDLNRALVSGKLSPEARAAALAISAWFSVQGCVTRFGGIPIPTGTGLTTRIWDQGTRALDQGVRGIVGQGARVIKDVGVGLWRIIRPVF